MKHRNIAIMSRLNQNNFLSNTMVLHIALLIAAFIFAYFDTILSLVKTWSGRNDYSHGFIVPFASLYFVYAMRDKLKAIEIAPSAALGSAVTMAGVLMLMLGNVGGITTIQQFSMLLVIPGLVILLLGIEMFKALLLPLGYLVLMVPLMLDLIFNPLHWPFQLFGAKIASTLLSVLGIPIYHNAQFIELPSNSLEVANACSGIRYLVSIIALAVPLAYLTQKTWSRKVVLVTSSIIIGILANPVRIAIIGLWVYSGGSILHGPGHILQGYFVSVVGFLFLFIMAFILNRPHSSGVQKMLATSSQAMVEDPKKSSDVSGSSVQKIEVINGISCHWQGWQRNHKTVWLYAIVIMLLVGCFITFYKPIPVSLKGHQDKLPLELEGWKGSVIDGKDDSIIRLPAPDTVIRRSYIGMSGKSLYLMAGYYEYQKQDKEYIHYTMQKLYDKSKECRLQIAEGQYITTKRIIINEANKKQLVTYWYVIDGYVTSNNIKAKFITAVRGIVERRTNGSIVLIASDLNATESVESVSGQQEKFVAAIYPFLKDYLNSY